jgi:endonuclease YncB( thermonuclease family)
LVPANIFWDPTSLTVDSLGKKKLLGVSDGDTTKISVSIRMLNMDTPEKHYPGNKKPSKQDANLAQLANWIQAGEAPIQPDLGAFLVPKLATGNAGTLQEEQGNQAEAVLETLLDEKLTLLSGKKRSLFVRAADEHFDQYGRLLAYIAPSYTSEELDSMSRLERATFNLMLVDAGWAASFPIYPSIPCYPDLVLLQTAGKDAVENKKGAWADPNSLTGYEFRMCVKLYEITKKMVSGKKLRSWEKCAWISRYCVDMTTREVCYPQDYFKVQPYNRIFIWPNDVAEAVTTMNLVPQK